MDPVPDAACAIVTSAYDLRTMIDRLEKTKLSDLPLGGPLHDQWFSMDPARDLGDLQAELTGTGLRA